MTERRVRRVRGGRGERAESGWKDRHQPKEAMTHIKSEAESKMMHSDKK